MPAAIGITIKMLKNPAIEVVVDILSIKLAVSPAKKFPIKVHIKKTPNIIPTSLFGASLLT